MMTPPLPDPVLTPGLLLDGGATRPASGGRRRLTVLDLLILVAATAIGLAMTRTLAGFITFWEIGTIFVVLDSAPGVTSHGSWGSPQLVLDYSGPGRVLGDRPSYWLTHIPYWSGPCLVAWSVAALWLSLRGPRSTRRRAIRDAGPVGALAIGLTLALQAIRFAQTGAATGKLWAFLGSKGQYLWNYHWITFPRLAGLGVICSWLVLLVAGRRSKRPDGPERLGRAVGWCWIAMAVSAEVGVWLFLFNL